MGFVSAGLPLICTVSDNFVAGVATVAAAYKTYSCCGAGRCGKKKKKKKKSRRKRKKPISENAQQLLNRFSFCLFV